jgi:hypothetical protein
VRDPFFEELPPRVFASARNLVVDNVTAQVVPEFTRAGIRAILLKGPSVVRWLYPEDPRLYADTDLLVSPQDAETAEAILRTLKFEPPLPERPAEKAWQVHDWRRNRDGAFIDLHRTIPGAEASPEAVWAVLTRETDQIVVAGVSVEILSLAARALHVALHAAQPGADMTNPLEDLRRALDWTGLALWRAASEIATEIGAAKAFRAGLSLLPSGREILSQLGMDRTLRTKTLLAHTDVARSAAGYALALEELTEVQGLPKKFVWLWGKAFPSPAFLRYWTPMARRGPAGLLAAYVWRWIWLAKTAGPGVTAWLWAHRQRQQSVPTKNS